MNVIREEFLLLTERLKLDTQFWSQEFGVQSLESVVKSLESELNTFLTQDSGQIYVGPYTANWQYDKIPIRRLSNSELEAIAGVYKNLFLPDRQIKLIGVDLDDCLYDVTPIRQLLIQKIHTALKPFPLSLRAPLQIATGRAEGEAISWALYNVYKDDLEAEDIRKQKALTVLKQYVIASPVANCYGASEAKQSHIEEIVERTYCAYKNFSRLDDPNIRALYKPYEGVKNTLRHLVDRGDFIVGILTNGPSKFQKDKIGLLGLKEGKHFNFIMVSEDTGIGKPHKGFFDLARERASQLRNAACEMRNNSSFRNPKSEIRNEECLILEDQVKNLSGADGWLKVQFLRGYHSNTLPANVQEIPKYGITSFSLIPDLINLEKDSDFQAIAASYFILKSLLLIAHSA